MEGRRGVGRAPAVGRTAVGTGGAGMGRASVLPVQSQDPGRKEQLNGVRSGSSSNVGHPASVPHCG